MGNLFPTGYPIDVLDGVRVPTNDEVKRTMAQRASWLMHRVECRARLGQRVALELMELASIARLIDMLEATERKVADAG